MFWKKGIYLLWIQLPNSNTCPEQYQYHSRGGYLHLSAFLQAKWYIWWRQKISGGTYLLFEKHKDMWNYNSEQDKQQQELQKYWWLQKRPYQLECGLCINSMRVLKSK